MTSTAPLHVQLYEALRAHIVDGTWPEGSRVPSEAELMAEYGVSRAPVRQALAALRSEGAIVGPRGAPPRVQRLVPTQSFDTFMSFTEWAYELGRVPGQRTMEVAKRPARPDLAADLQMTPGAPVVDVIRLRLLDDQPTMLERSSYPADIGQHLLEADLDSGSVYLLLQQHGFAPARARHLIDAVAADDFDSACLNITPDSPLLRVRRQSFSELGQIIEVADDRYLPHLANFVIENTHTQRSALTRETTRPAVTRP